MNFRDTVKRYDSLFVDPQIFGSIHTVEGREIPITIDDHSLTERKGGAELAVAGSTLQFYARVEDLPPRPALGHVVDVDGALYIVDDWAENMGIATVTLSRTEHR